MQDTPRGDYFEWQVNLPASTWAGLIGTAHIRSADRQTLVHSMAGTVTINGNGTALVIFSASKATTRTWTPGIYRLDAELERPGLWGPFTITLEPGDDRLRVTADVTITTA
jgi:hypothetical protein